MKKITHTIIFLLLASISWAQSFTPSALTVTGGYAEIGNTNFSWSIGQTFNNTLAGNGNIITQGVQQINLNPQPPVITSFNPGVAGSGASVTIMGNNFTGTTSVHFGTLPAASFTVVNPTTIIAVVGAGEAGSVHVVTPLGEASLSGFSFCTSVMVSLSITANTSNTICSGTSVIFTALPVNGGTDPVYQWKRNGDNVGTNSYEYTSSALQAGDNISCMMTSNVFCPVNPLAVSNSIAFTVVTNVTPFINITADNSTACEGHNITFTASPTNEGIAPSYQWKKNGIDITGATASTYTSGNLANGDNITCRLTSSLSCITSVTAISNSIGVTIIPNVMPAVNITATPAGAVCAGTSVTFNATPVNAGTAPGYQWKKNGVNVGTNTTSYSDPNLANGDIISFVLTSDAVCAVFPVVNSNSITETVNPILTPSISISADATAFCPGIGATFTANATSTGSSPIYQWRKNGVNISGANSVTYFANTLNANDAISCFYTSNAPCTTVSSVLSNSIILPVSLLPNIITPVATPSLICRGESSQLNSGFVPNNYNFTVSSIPYGHITVPGGAPTGPTGDDIIQGPFNIPFTFNFFGNNYSNFYISTNGNIQFGPTRSVQYNAAPVPYLMMPNFISFCWSDIIVGQGYNAGSIHYFIDGTSPSRKMIIDYSNCSFYQGINNGAVAGQIWLYETTGIVEIHLTQSIDPNNRNKTIGVNNITGNIGLAAPGRNGTPWQASSPEAWRFTPTDPLGNYTFNWTPGINLNDSSSRTPIANPIFNTTYNVLITDNLTGCTSHGSTILTVDSIVTPGIVISQDMIMVCSGQLVTFTATQMNGGTDPDYQWKKNGNNVGTKHPVYRDSTLNNNDIITCILTSSINCVSSRSVVSNALSMTVLAYVSPSVVIVSNPTATTIPGGNSVLFTAIPVYGGNNPTYQWKKNGNDVGTNGANYTDAALNNGDVVSCVLTSNYSCLITPTATSNSIILTVYPAIVAFTPAMSPVGGMVTITGYNFTNATAVGFGGVPATSFIVLNSNTIIATVGQGANGSVTVTTIAGTGSLAGFSITPPILVSFNPGIAAAGSTVTLTGNNFMGTTAVSFGGIAAGSFIVVNSTTITAVPASGITGAVSITTPGGTATLAGFIFDGNIARLGLSPEVVPTTGGYSTGNGISLSWTMGQPFNNSLITGDAILTQGFQQTAALPAIALKLKIYLQGYYAGNNMMEPVLYNQDLPAALLSQTDTIVIELYDPVTATLVDFQKAILLTTGRTSAIFIRPGGFYLVAVKHRNSLQTWSANPIMITSLTSLYDFTITAGQAYGDNQIEVEPGVWSFYVGDLNQDEYIDAFDYSGYNDDNLAGVNGVYIATDMNGDGYVDAFDYSMYNDNNLNGIQSIHP